LAIETVIPDEAQRRSGIAFRTRR